MAAWDEERIALKQQIAADSIASVLKVLKEKLPRQGERYEDVLLLESRQNEANRKRLRNLLSDEELRRIYAQIRQDLMDLLDALQADDFDEAAVAKKQTESGPEKGSILYRIPDHMQIGAWTNCVVRISFEEEKLIENIDLDEHVAIEQIRISEVMRVELLDPDDDPPFSIQAIHSPEQFIDEDTFTEWLFRVKPLREGTFPLLLKVSVIELIMGKERKRELVLTEEVIITAAAPEEKEEQPLRPAGHFYTGGALPPQEETMIDLDDSRVAKREVTKKKSPSTASADQPVQPAPAPPQDKTATSTRGGSRLRYVLRSLTVALIAFGGLLGGLYAINPAEGAWLATHYVKRSAQSYQQYAENFPESPHAERAYWQVAQLKEDNDDYLAYLERYPTGRFTGKALSEMKEREVLPDRLQEKELTQIKNIREVAVETIELRETVRRANETPDPEQRQIILNDYVRKHPDTYLDREVEVLQEQLERSRGGTEKLEIPDGIREFRPDRERPDRLDDRRSSVETERLLPARRDSLAWQRVRESGGEEGMIKNYLETYPEGVFAEKARNLLSVRREESNLRRELTTDDSRRVLETNTPAVREYRKLIQEDIRLLAPPSAEELIQLLDQKLPANAPERSEMEKIGEELAKINELEKARRISSAEAKERRQELRTMLQKIVDSL